jgi:hypothetical protein
MGGMAFFQVFLVTPSEKKFRHKEHKRHKEKNSFALFVSFVAENFLPVRFELLRVFVAGLRRLG